MAKIKTFNNAPGAAYFDNSITINTAQQTEKESYYPDNQEQKEMTPDDFYLSNPSGQLFYPNKQYHPINYIRILNAMYELGYFLDEQGSKPNKVDFFKQIGIVLGMNFTHYSTNLSESITKSNDYSEAVTEKLFDELKKKALDYVEFIKQGDKKKKGIR